MQTQAYDDQTHRSDEQERAARRCSEQARAFHAHVAVFAGGMAVIAAVNLATNLMAGTAGELSAWWSIWALIGWSAGIAVHGLVVRLNRSAAPST